MLPTSFWDRPPDVVAEDLVGRVLRRRHGQLWLAAAIVEVEAYGVGDRASHSWLGRTPSRESMWAAPGTIYMYFSRGGDSLNVSVRGDGAAVLVKAARPWLDERSGDDSLAAMHRLNPGPRGPRPDHRLLAGQTLLARALDLRVREWDGRAFDRDAFLVEDAGYRPEAVVRAPRLGIPPGRDEHLARRFVDAAHLRSATRPLPRP